MTIFKSCFSLSLMFQAKFKHNNYNIIEKLNIFVSLKKMKLKLLVQNRIDIEKIKYRR